MTVRIELTVTCITCPLAFEGTVGDLEVDYRARHGRWRIVLPDVLDRAVTEQNPQLLEGKCTSDEETSIEFAMTRLFAVPEVRRALWDRDARDLDEMYEAAGL